MTDVILINGGFTMSLIFPFILVLIDKGSLGFPLKKCARIGEFVPKSGNRCIPVNFTCSVIWVLPFG